MRYIIMCGGNWAMINNKPKHIYRVNGERIIDRTIRLLREAGVKDIAITTDKPRFFKKCDAEIIKYKNPGQWTNGFYPTTRRTCYICGDVYFSPDAIKKIVNKKTNDIEFFASAPPFGNKYIKRFAEPFAFKVVNMRRFRKCINLTQQYVREGKLYRDISWELWQVIKGTPLNKIDYTNYTVINDYTVDIHHPYEAERLERELNI